MSCSFPNAAGRRFTVNCASTLGKVSEGLAAQKESRIEEGHLMVDHVHMMIAIPPKYAVSQVVGFIKGKSAIHLARSMASKSGILLGSIFGRGDISSHCRAR
jgi:putative transposase